MKQLSDDCCLSNASCLAALIVAAALLAGCGEAPTLDAPDVRWGQDTCDVCGMILSDERFAGAVVTIEAGERRVALFDDIGEMLAAQRRAPSPPKYPQRLWVTDSDTKQWIDAESAHYLKSDQLHTPMGFGVAAYADAQVARDAQEQWGGQVGSLAQIGQVSSPDHGHAHDAEQ